MKHSAITAIMLLATTMGFSQADTTAKTASPDTLRAGNFIIIKKEKPPVKTLSVSIGSDDGVSVEISKNSTPKAKRNVSTNYFIFDLGFANYRDQTNYPFAQSTGFLKQLGPAANGKPDQNSNSLNTGKSSNVNIWLFMQKRNIYNHVVNLKYGLGLEMYNFRYEHNLSYRKDPVPFAFNDSISFTKNKLFVEYLTIPLMVNINTNPNKHHAFTFSAGISAGYLIASRNKQISAEHGKQKYKGDFNLQPWRIAAIGEVGLGPVRLYGSYSFNALHKDFTGMQQYPYAIGIRFSHW